MATLLTERSGDERTCQSRTCDGNSTGLGDLLRGARERRGLTLQQIANETKIPQRHLEALETGDLAASPGAFYRRAEIRAYARAVHLDQHLALAQLENDLEASLVHHAAEPETPRARRLPISRTGILIVIGAVVAAGVFGRAVGGRVLPEPTPDATVGASERGFVDQTAPTAAAPLQEVLTEARASAASNSDSAATGQHAEVQALADSVTELVVVTQPAGASVTVNGIGWGTAPVTIRYLPPGDKRIRVSSEGYVTAERVVPLVQGHQATVDIQLTSLP